MLIQLFTFHHDIDKIIVNYNAFDIIWFLVYIVLVHMLKSKLYTILQQILKSKTEPENSQAPRSSFFSLISI